MTLDATIQAARAYRSASSTNGANPTLLRVRVVVEAVPDDRDPARPPRWVIATEGFQAERDPLPTLERAAEAETARLIDAIESLHAEAANIAERRARALEAARGSAA